ncbi:MAG: hypothetical protein ACO1SV_21610 [Fimbriimonas sp.]
MFSTERRETNRALMGCGKPNRKGVIRYEIKSDDRPSVKHVVAAQVGTGRVHCTCEHFAAECARFNPIIGFGPVCKHIRTYRQTILRELVAADKPTARGEAVAGLVLDNSAGYPQWTVAGAQ